MRQRVDNGFVGAFFQHGREDHLLITLSAATEGREESLHVRACSSITQQDETCLKPDMPRLLFYNNQHLSPVVLTLCAALRMFRAAS